jgi:hypothetical protein
VSKLIVQVGPATVVIRDDTAVMDKATLKAWKNAARELIEGAVDLLTLPVEEEVGDE